METVLLDEHKNRILTPRENKFVDSLKIEGKESNAIKEEIKEEWRKRPDCQIKKNKFSFKQIMQNFSLRLMMPLYAVLLWANYLGVSEIYSNFWLSSKDLSNIDNAFSVIILFLLIIMDFILLLSGIGMGILPNKLDADDFEEKDKKIIFDSNFLKILKPSKWYNNIWGTIIFIAILSGLVLTWSTLHGWIFILYLLFYFIMKFLKNQIKKVLVSWVNLMRREKEINAS